MPCKSHKYDTVKGPMAADTFYNYVQNYIEGEILGAAFWELAKFNHSKYQISFLHGSCTEHLEIHRK